MYFAMMDHERPTFLMHIRTRQTPMRNEGAREGEREGGRRERRWGNTVKERKRITEKGEREQAWRVPVPPELINRCPLRPPSRTPTMPSSGVHQ